MAERIWGLPFLLLGLYLMLMPGERFKREAERDARRLAKVFPWMNERSIKQEVRTQLILRKIVPPIFVVVGALTLLGVLDVGEA